MATGGYEWVVFTSANAVNALLERIPDLRRLGRTQIAAVGAATASTLAGRGLVADLLPSPDRQQAEGLLHVFPPPSKPGAKVLFPRAAGGRETIVAGLTSEGWDVDLVEAYRTVRVRATESHARAVAGANAVCFASSSAVSGFVEALGLAAVPPLVVCIGPVTAKTAAEAGLRVDAVATEHTVEGLVAALVEHIAFTNKKLG
jgi:uroporphyrinogen III methyltransferase/synthase